MTLAQAEMDRRFMREAMAQARMAGELGEVPVGAVVHEAAR